jgi:hypothetical protein
VHVADGVVPGSVVVEFQADPAARPFICFCHGDRSFPSDFASVPRPFHAGWAEFEKRIGLRTPSRESAGTLPSWLEFCRANLSQIRQLGPKEIFTGCWRNAPTYLTWDSNGVPHFYIPFADGWESFDHALWEDLGSVPFECFDDPKPEPV